MPGNHKSRQFHFIATSVPHSTVNQKPLETSPDTLQHQESILHQIHDQSHQFHIYSTHPHFRCSTTLAYSASSIISEAPDLSNSIPIVLALSLLQKESRFFLHSCMFDLSLISQYSLVPFGFNFAFPYIKFTYFTATLPSIKTSCIYLKTTEK